MSPGVAENGDTMQHVTSIDAASTHYGITLAPAVLSEEDAARYCGFSRSYLRKARRFGRGPAFLREGRAVRYALADLQAWIDSLRVTHCGNA